MSRIEDYALLGDLQTAALISSTAPIHWPCLPRFDSRLNRRPGGHHDAGHWIIAPPPAGIFP